MQFLALGHREQQLGEDHPDTAQALYNLGHLLRQKGDIPAAVEVFSQALARAEASLGADDALTRDIRNSLARIRP